MYDIQRFAATLIVAEHFRPLVTFRAFALLWSEEDYEEIKDMLIEAEMIREFTISHSDGLFEVYWGWND